jgi:branched-chain amino acid transport system permease protein
LPRLSRWSLAFVLTMAVLGMLPILPLPAFFFNVLAITFMFAAMSDSWTLIGGYTGYMNIGSAAFFGIGAYTTAILLQSYHLSPLLTAPVAGIFAVSLALVVGIPTLRLRGSYFALATLTLPLLMSDLFVALPDFTGGGRGIMNLHLPGVRVGLEPQVFYVSFFSLMIIAMLVAYAVENSKFGLGLMAIREDEDAARMCAVDATKLKNIAFMISAFFIGVAGGLYTPYLSYVNPSLAFDILITISPVLMAIFGGKGTWIGPIIGAFILDLVRQYLSFLILSEMNTLVFGLMLIAVMMLMPNGIIGFLRSPRFARLRNSKRA